MKNITLDISNLENSAAPLYCQYDGQCQPQPAYVYLDCRTCVVTADWSGEIGNSMSMDVWNHLDQRWSVQSNVVGYVLAEYLEGDEFKSLAQKIVDGFEDVYDGSNYVGKYTIEAQEAIETIGHDLEQIDVASVYDADEWLDNVLIHNGDDGLESATEITIDDDTITAKTSDKELASMATTINFNIDQDQQVEGVEEYLQDLRTICVDNSQVMGTAYQALVANNLDWYIAEMTNGTYRLMHNSALSSILECGAAPEAFGIAALHQCWNGDELGECPFADDAELTE